LCQQIKKDAQSERPQPVVSSILQASNYLGRYPLVPAVEASVFDFSDCAAAFAGEADHR